MRRLFSLAILGFAFTAFTPAGTLTMYCPNWTFKTPVNHNGGWACGDLTYGEGTVTFFGETLTAQSGTYATGGSYIETDSVLVYYANPAVLGGYFVPCFSFTSPAGDSASGSFGGVTPSPNCTSDSNPADRIPFKFGVAQKEMLQLSVSSIIGSGPAVATFTGLQIYDASGNNITSNTAYQVVDTDLPEPGTALLFTAALCSAGLYQLSRRFSLHWR